MKKGNLGMVRGIQGVLFGQHQSNETPDRSNHLTKEEKVHGGSKGDTQKAGEEDGASDGADRFSAQILAQNPTDDASEDCGKHLETR